MSDEEKVRRSQSAKNFWNSLSKEEKEKSSRGQFGNVAKKNSQRIWEERKKIHHLFSDRSIWRRYDYYSRLVKNPEAIISALSATVCSVCEHPPEKRALAIDHDHKKMIIRGALCSRCNFALGHVSDDPEILEKLAAYLRKYRID